MATYRSRGYPKPQPPIPPGRSGFEKINGHALWWECYGPEDGPPVVLLHHGLGSVQSWKRQIPALVRSGWQVVAYDRWGYGKSDPRPVFKTGFLREDSLEGLQLIDALGLENVSLVGHSDGGSIAIILAAIASRRIEKLVLVAAHAFMEARMQEGLGRIRSNLKDERFFAVLAREHGEKARSLADRWMEGWSLHGQETVDLGEELSRIHCPTLVIQGLQDEHASTQHAVQIAQAIPGSELWLIPGIGHMPTHHIAEKFNQRVLEFLEQEAPSRREWNSTEEAGNV
jgi:pimeloyl-ACP methyl ester carboxylesterase